MPDDMVIAVDLADVESAAGKHITTLGWGDPVEVLDEAAGRVRVRLTRFLKRRDGSEEPVETEGFIGTKLKGGGQAARVVADRAEAGVLKVDFVDVQQGDGTVIETPSGQVVLLDGGDNQLFARYLAGRFRGTSADAPREIAAIVVSHGDADHFSGLARIAESETNDNLKKRVFIRPVRVFHNGLVKRPSRRPEVEQLGATQVAAGRTLITGLETDLLAVPDREMNGPFKAWKKALKQISRGKDIEFRRLALGDDDAFGFLARDDIGVDVLGPILTTIDGITGLEFLGTPQRRFGHPEENETTFTGKSASHTINGHSIVLRLRYGKFGFLFAGDLNEQAERRLLAQNKQALRSEVFKVPHHGSADYLRDFLEAVGPIVSVVSSGDDGSDYIHPRATLMAALGRYGRSRDPVVFVTEMVAFFKAEGYVTPPKRGRFFAFSRAAFGIVKVRTDGRRLLVYTNSGQADMKEAYAYTLERGRGVPQKLLSV
jgi:hypothetical protein